MDKDLASLIDRIYEAALEPSYWQGLLNDIASWLDCCGADMSVVHSHHGVVKNVSVAPDDTALTEYVDYYWAVNPRIEYAMEAKVGRLLTDHDIPAHQIRKSEFFNDYLPRHRFGAYLGTLLQNDRDLMAYVAFLIPRDADKGSEQQMERFNSLIPHLVRGHQIQTRVGNLQNHNATLTAVGDGIRAGVLVLDRQGRAVFMNQSAQRLIQEGDGLALDGLRPVPRFRGARHGFDTALAQVLNATGKDRPPSSGAALQLPRKGGRRPLNVLVSHLPKRHLIGGGVAAVFITDPERMAPGTETRLADLYNLTRREAALARDLMNGLSVEDHTRARGISLATGRTHLRSLLRKTHTHRQGELVALLMRSDASQFWTE